MDEFFYPNYNIKDGGVKDGLIRFRVPKMNMQIYFHGRWTDVAGATGGTGIVTLQIVKPTNGLHLVVKQSMMDGSLGNANTIIDTEQNASDREFVSAFLSNGNDGRFYKCPETGFGSPYDNAAVIVNLENVQTPTFLFYAWKNELGQLSDGKATYFPSASM